MILSPISLLDCFVFLVLLTPRLLWSPGLFATLIAVIKALPFFLFRLPTQFIRERYLTRPSQQPPFVQTATVFEDFVVRCVRYAFKEFPPVLGRAFFSKYVALGFVRWRLLRHGYLRLPGHWKEQAFGDQSVKGRGIWITHKPDLPPDFVLYYAHGGGFVMGSCYFYMEFMLAWHQLLIEAGFSNPAIFSLEYTLVPDDVYPRQILETVQGYRHVLSRVKDASKVCVAGDSAGGALMLSLLLELGAQSSARKSVPSAREGVEGDHISGSLEAMGVPGMAMLISPWITLMTDRHRASRNDYLDRRTLWKYAHDYAGEAMVKRQPASPGDCMDEALWKAASPRRGYFVIFGSEEVFAPDIDDFLKRQTKMGIEAEGQKFDGGIHAWPVASLFLSNTIDKRLQGLRIAMREIRRRMLEGGDMNGQKE